MVEAVIIGLNFLTIDDVHDVEGSPLRIVYIDVLYYIKIIIVVVKGEIFDSNYYGGFLDFGPEDSISNGEVLIQHKNMNRVFYYNDRRTGMSVGL